MSLTKQVRDMWCRFQGEFFPEIQAEVGPLFKNVECHTTMTLYEGKFRLNSTLPLWL